ncbi:MAG: DUF4338 domain-containing protein [Magnetococcales bacterium]|nr:DUF4338 domain-containing protein [Magnetococcales bacterium]
MATKQPPHQICNRPFGDEGLITVREVIGNIDLGAISRTEVARRVCIAMDWRNAQGKLKEMGARVALLRLHRQGLITLPEPKNGNGNGKADRLAELSVLGFVESDVCCPLAELGEVLLHKVESRDDSLLWDGIIDRYHYLGHSPLSGAQIRYLIHSGPGVIGAIGFGAAAFSLKDRDRWIGWDRRQREQRREWIINNRRFLILPWIRVKNLASHILSKAAHQVREDFRLQYGYAPFLLETFVEQDRFTGGCYRAANWINVGLTAGRGRNDRTRRERGQHGTPLPIKQIWLYPLCRDVRERLCAPLEPLNGVRALMGEAA